MAGKKAEEANTRVGKGEHEKTRKDSKCRKKGKITKEKEKKGFKNQSLKIRVGYI
jgi:hypothetical protein